MSRNIPDRWLAYEPYGTVIGDTNILAIKVPLKETISRQLPPQKQFTPAKLMANFPKLKFLVDLTNTNRYYNAKEFQEAGIKYIKIMVPGQQVPSLECVKRFCAVMHQFNSEAKSGELIGVHCTHGINRTGYLICRYLVQQLGWEPQKSLKAFEKARGYPIERAAYVTNLMNVSRGKLDVSDVNLRVGRHRFDRARNVNGRPYPLPPRPPFNGLPPPRPFGGPRPPIMPPLPPPPPGRWLDGPRPQAYGMLGPRPPGLGPRPPGPGPFPGPRFASRMSGPPGIPCPSRLPPPNIGPPSRLPGPGMPPPRLPPPGMIPPRIPPPGISPRLPPPGSGPFIRTKAAKLSNVSLGTSDSNLGLKTAKDLDFTVDTFDENLTASVGP
ncbi:RNA/RNP complex-1-interacting phosphatase isoform X2 [Venturia canescens]|uniref:RNA/RNP complex-1-interacting phosphatase isoform X2 n=1 Tax=Venturia canescens TaxID=32260 RepID=UPI001C9C5AD8|nr:RNA/RNP complex-1-interacting phosphatase-like isoform X2 [Venturia canescens]